MSIKKKTATKVQESKPKYNVGQKVFTIYYHKGMPEELLETEIVSRTKREYREENYLGRGTTLGASFTYTCKTSSVPAILKEEEVYPNYTEAAKVFSKP